MAKKKKKSGAKARSTHNIPQNHKPQPSRSSVMEANRGPSWLEMVVVLGTLLLLVLYPLFNTNGLYQNLEAKYLFLTRFGTVFVLLSVILLLVSNRKDLNFRKTGTEKKWLLLFGLAIVVSACAATDPAEAWIGESARKLNAWVLLLCIAIFLIISAYVRISDLLFWVLVIGNSVISLLAILNFYGIDTMNSYSLLSDADKRIYLGLFGNINTNAAYTSLMLALAVMLCLHAAGKAKKIAAYIWLFLVCMHAFAARSDSIAITFIVLYAFLWIYTLSIPSRAGERKLWLRTKKVAGSTGICLVFLLTSVIMQLTVRFLKGQNVAIAKYGKSLLRRFFTIRGLWIQAGLLVLILAAVLLAASIAVKKEKGESSGTGKRIGIGILCAALVLGAVVLVLNLFFYDRDLGALSFLILPASAGTGRMGLWRLTLAAIGGSGIKQVLVGCGPNNYYSLMYPMYETELSALQSGVVFNDAHNDLLQYFSVTGLFGLVTYLGFLLTLLKKGLHSLHTNPYAAATVALLLAYFVQGIANNPSIFTTPLFFVYLAILAAGMRKEKGR